MKHGTVRSLRRKLGEVRKHGGYPTFLGSLVGKAPLFCEEKQKKSVVILGDMLELGRYAVIAHQSVIQQIIDSDIDEVLTIGEYFLETKSKDQRLKKFKTITEAEKYISEKSYIDRDFLIKGSRRIALERLIELL